MITYLLAIVSLSVCIKITMFLLKPSDIFYTQDNINNVFTGRHMHSGKHIGTTLDELADGRTTVEQISRISVKDINGKWFTSDNRRLWVFKNFELLGGCKYIPVIRTTYIDPRKFTTCNGGNSIIVRRSPGGIWYNKLLTNPSKYKNCLLRSFIDPYSCTEFSKSKPPSYPEADNTEGFATIRQDIDTPSAFVFQSNSNFAYHEQSHLNRTTSDIKQRLSRGSTSTPYARLLGGKHLSVTVKNAEEPLQVASLDQICGKFEFNLTVSSSHSAKFSGGTSLKNYTERVEEVMPCITQKSSERPTCNYGNITGSNVSIVQYQKRNRDVDQNRPSNTDGSPLPGTTTTSFEERSHSTGTKLKPASRQAFTQLVNVKQMKVNPKIPVTILLDPSEIRYTKEAFEYPPSNNRWPTVQSRLLDLLKTENQKPLEAYKAYGIYWVKEENDVLWFLKEHPECRKTKIKLKVLVIEDNDAFLDFMRKEKPWLQISDILQLGLNTELIR